MKELKRLLINTKQVNTKSHRRHRDGSVSPFFTVAKRKCIYFALQLNNKGLAP